MTPFPDRIAVAYLNNGNSLIAVDNHCYVLMDFTSKRWITNPYLSQEVLEVITSLPLNPDKATPVNINKCVE